QYEVIEDIRNSLDVLAIQGSGTSISTLTQAGVKDADLLIALTNVDEINIVASMIAKQLGVKSCLARVRNPEYTLPDTPVKLKSLGIDLVIQPEKETAREVVRLVRYPDAIDVVECSDTHTVIIGLKLPPETPLKGEQLGIITQEHLSDITFRLVAVSRDNETYIPGGKFVLQSGDLIYFICHKQDIERIFNLVGREYRMARDVMILGGGYVSELVAQELEREKGYRVKLVESDWEKSHHAAELLTTTMVVKSKEMADVDLLTVEGLPDMDVFAALSDDDENNIVTSLLARHLRVKRIITRVDKLQYLPIARAIGLDITINEHIITADAILSFLKGSSVLNVVKLRGLKAEIIELDVGPQSKVVRKALKDVSFPKGLLVGAIVHNGRTSIAVGNSVIEPRDRVIVFVEEQVKGEVEKYFL
ncbi:MAG: Trk system potassium transporter TrkA, partial [bacterium]